MADVPLLSHGRQTVTAVLPADQDSSENAGFVVFGRSGDHDILFWSCAYIMGDAPHTQWIVPGARIHGTIFMAIPRTDVPMLTDNAFIRNGLHLPEYRAPRRFDIEESAERATWHVDGRRYIWEPPHWRIEGEYGGVDVDLEFTAVADATWAAGRFEDIVQNNGGGYDVPIEAIGRIDAGGETYDLTDARGSHERAGMGQGRDIVAEGATGEVLVADLFVDDLHVLFGQHTGRDMAFGRIDVGGRSIPVIPATGAGTMSISTIDRWHDPRSGLFVPSRWSVAMVADGVTVDLDVQVIGRAYWHYTTTSGVMVMMWQLSRASGVVYLPDGTERVIDDALVAGRWGRSLLVANETITGPRFEALEEFARLAT